MSCQQYKALSSNTFFPSNYSRIVDQWIGTNNSFVSEKFDLAVRDGHWVREETLSKLCHRLGYMALFSSWSVTPISARSMISKHERLFQCPMYQCVQCKIIATFIKLEVQYDLDTLCKLNWLVGSEMNAMFYEKPPHSPNCCFHTACMSIEIEPASSYRDAEVSMKSCFYTLQ